MCRAPHLSLDTNVAVQIPHGHRFINVYLHKMGPRFQIKLLDFGFAALVDDFIDERRLTRDGEITGTPRYLAPEQVLGIPTSDRTDFYSAGIVLFEIMTGEFPYSVESDSLPALILAHSSGQARRLGTVGSRSFGQIEEVISARFARTAETDPTQFGSFSS